MNLKEQIERVDARMVSLQKQRDALLLLEQKLADYPDHLHVSLPDDYIDFDGLKRSDVVKLLTHLRTGKWNKTPVGDRVNYTNETFLPGVKLRIYAAEPPSGCKIVYEDVVIPAQPARVEKRPKMVCKETHVVGV